MPPESGAHYFAARIGGQDAAAISSVARGRARQATWNTYVWVDSADDAAAKVREAGGTVLSEPFDVFDAGRMAVFTDPEGAVFCVWQPNRHRGATVVNEHGARQLQQPPHARSRRGEGLLRRRVRLDDARRSAPASRRGRCPATATTWRRSTRHARAQRRAGRAGRLRGRRRGARPDRRRPAGHAGALERHVRRRRRGRGRRATTALGGTVLAGPFDAPWVRMAVIADPAGATFTASQFVPDGQRAAAV